MRKRRTFIWVVLPLILLLLVGVFRFYSRIPLSTEEEIQFVSIEYLLANTGTGKSSGLLLTVKIRERSNAVVKPVSEGLMQRLQRRFPNITWRTRDPITGSMPHYPQDDTAEGFGYVELPNIISQTSDSAIIEFRSNFQVGCPSPSVSNTFYLSRIWGNHWRVKPTNVMWTFAC